MIPAVPNIEISIMPYKLRFYIALCAAVIGETWKTHFYRDLQCCSHVNIDHLFVSDNEKVITECSYGEETPSRRLFF